MKFRVTLTVQYSEVCYDFDKIVDAVQFLSFLSTKRADDNIDEKYGTYGAALTIIPKEA